jgi:hypothetical protein
MLTVHFRRDGRERLSSFFADGHAGWADSGEDIVCAAVSAILQAAWLGLEEHARVAPEADKSAGRLALRWPAEVRERPDVQAIVATAELAVTQISRQYPAHVQVVREAETEAG